MERIPSGRGGWRRALDTAAKSITQNVMRSSYFIVTRLQAANGVDGLARAVDGMIEHLLHLKEVNRRELEGALWPGRLWILILVGSADEAEAADDRPGAGTRRRTTRHASLQSLFDSRLSQVAYQLASETRLPGAEAARQAHLRFFYSSDDLIEFMVDEAQKAYGITGRYAAGNAAFRGLVVHGKPAGSSWR